jgi:hypothetical protein
MVLLAHNDEQQLKEVPDIPQEILKAASSGKLVMFIGAGVSRIIGCPSWKEFALLQLRDLYEKRVINFYEFKNLGSLDARRLLSICRNIYEENDIKPQNMGSLLSGKDELMKKFTIYEDLYSFNVVYLTTNYEDYLDKVAQKPTAKLASITKTTKTQDSVEEEIAQSKIIHSKEQLLISNLVNGSIIHLHGSIHDERNTIVTIVDYMKHYEHDSKPAVLLEEIFDSYTVLFVGYGLEEYEIMEFMISKSHTSKGEVKHFMLYPVFRREINLLAFQRKYYRDLGVQLIAYPIDENGYEQLAPIIHEWAKRIGPVSRPQGFLERIKLIDEVI